MLQPACHFISLLFSSFLPKFISLSLLSSNSFVFFDWRLIISVIQFVYLKVYLKFGFNRIYNERLEIEDECYLVKRISFDKKGSYLVWYLSSFKVWHLSSFIRGLLVFFYCWKFSSFFAEWFFLLTLWAHRVIQSKNYRFHLQEKKRKKLQRCTNFQF